MQSCCSLAMEGLGLSLTSTGIKVLPKLENAFLVRKHQYLGNKDILARYDNDYVAHGALVKLILAADVPLISALELLPVAHGAAVIGSVVLTASPLRAGRLRLTDFVVGSVLEAGPRFAAILAPVEGGGSEVALLDHGAAVPKGFSGGPLAVG